VGYAHRLLHVPPHASRSSTSVPQSPCIECSRRMLPVLVVPAQPANETYAPKRHSSYSLEIVIHLPRHDIGYASSAELCSGPWSKCEIMHRASTRSNGLAQPSPKLKPHASTKFQRIIARVGRSISESQLQDSQVLNRSVRDSELAVGRQSAARPRLYVQVHEDVTLPSLSAEDLGSEEASDLSLRAARAPDRVGHW
jgi:hypothetical protein